MERLQKLMARANLGSRRQNETLIAAGKVWVNGRVAKLGDKADPAVDKVTVNGRLLRLEDTSHTYIILNKPRGVISSLEDELEQGRTTIRDLVQISGHIYPVGRLDKQSEGLILFTDDGDLAHRLTHPRYQHEKIYNVEVEGQIQERTLELWRKGVMLDDKKTAPTKVRVLERKPASTRLQIIMREGRKRQIRRVSEQLGHSVERLVRIKIGPVKLGNLPRGKWRRLTIPEVRNLRKYVGLGSSKVSESHRKKKQYQGKSGKGRGKRVEHKRKGGRSKRY